MKYFYSRTTNGAYIDALNSFVPEDAVEITKKRYTDLFTVPIEGVIGSDANGRPMIIPNDGPTQAELLARERAWRDGELAKSDPIVARHRDQVESGFTTTLTQDQYAELQTYRTLLRDWPTNEQFPNAIGRPLPPGWLADEI